MNSSASVRLQDFSKDATRGEASKSTQAPPDFPEFGRSPDQNVTPLAITDYTPRRFPGAIAGDGSANDRWGAGAA
jgi:hypothetical protein